MKKPTNQMQEKSQPPKLIAIHSFNGKPMSDSERQKFVDGALSTADNAANSFQKEIVTEDEWSQ